MIQVNKACDTLINYIGKGEADEDLNTAKDQIMGFLKVYRHLATEENAYFVIRLLSDDIEYNEHLSTQQAQKEVAQALSLPHNTSYATPPNPLGHADTHHPPMDPRRQDTNQQHAQQTYAKQSTHFSGSWLDDLGMQYPTTAAGLQPRPYAEAKQTHSQSTDNRLETISYIPIDEGTHALVNKKDLKELRVTRDINKLTSTQRDEPGIRFTYENYEIFLSKDAYIHLSREPRLNQFQFQIKREMKKLAPDETTGNNFGEISRKIKQGKSGHRLGVWDVDIKNIKKEDLPT
jgi:hypothetical protein